MSITREQLNEALSEVEFYNYRGISEEAGDADQSRYRHAVKLLADVARGGEDVIDFCEGSGQEPSGSQCGDCYYEHGYVVPDHYYVPRS
jgi:hypothetical protein